MTRLWVKEMIQRQHEEHTKRIKEVRSTVDHKHKDVMYGRDRERERVNQRVTVQEQNRQIIDRIGKAMSKKRIDNETPSCSIVSLGIALRKRELRKVTQENLRILDRIQQIEPIYNRAQWEVENVKRERILRTISEFPDAYSRRPMTGLTGRKGARADLPSLSSEDSRPQSSSKFQRPSSTPFAAARFDIGRPMSGLDLWGSDTL